MRGGGYGELPKPELPDDSQGIQAAARKALMALKPVFLGVPKKDWIPLASALVERMRQDSPNPILVAIGLPGSGKTTVAARWIMLTDPFKGDPPSVAADVKAVYSAAQRRHSLLLDNVGRLDSEMENMLCVSAMGSQLTVKDFYVTVGTQDLPLKSAWVITSISMPIRQDDTHSRSLIIRITAPSGSQKRSDANMREEFASEHPAAFGALLWLLRERMRYVERNGPQSSVDRMVDWEITGEATTQNLGKPLGAYAKLRAQTRANQALDWLESETHFAVPLMATLTALAKGAQPAPSLPSQQTIYQAKLWVGNIGGRVSIAATAEGIRDEIRRRQRPTMHGVYEPDTPQRVRNKLAGIQSPLIKAGYAVEQHDTHGGRKHYWVLGLPV